MGRHCIAFPFVLSRSAPFSLIVSIQVSALESDMLEEQRKLIIQELIMWSNDQCAHKCWRTLHLPKAIDLSTTPCQKSSVHWKKVKFTFLILVEHLFSIKLGLSKGVFEAETGSLAPSSLLHVWDWKSRLFCKCRAVSLVRFQFVPSQAAVHFTCYAFYHLYVGHIFPHLLILKILKLIEVLKE